MRWFQIRGTGVDETQRADVIMSMLHDALAILPYRMCLIRFMLERGFVVAASVFRSLYSRRVYMDLLVGFFWSKHWRPHVVFLHRGNPFPAPPPLDCISPPLAATPGPLAPGCLLSAIMTGSSCLAATAPTPAPPAALVSPAPPEPWPGPRRISSSSPRSRHEGSFLVCVARWMPNAACWSGTTSSSSSGFTGWRCGGM
jgi:hypothetical protein